jgi:hypothetical protein
MKLLKLLRIKLGLFDGGTGSGTGAATGGATAGGNASAGAVSSVSTQQTNSGAKSQGAPAQSTSVAGENAKTLEERRKAYRELMDGEYKDLYQEDTQGLINRRFKDIKSIKETNAKQKSIIDILARKYNVDDGNLEKIQEGLNKDDDFWGEMAAMMGMDDVEQCKKFVFMEAETKSLREAEKARREAEEAARRVAQERKYVADKTAKWNAEGEALKSTYPEFSLETESQNKEFMSALTFFDRAQVQNPVERAYQATHHSELVNRAVEKTRNETEKNVVDNIRAKGKRPMENGVQNNSSFTAGVEWGNLTKAQRAELLRRAERGEIVTPYNK